MSISPETMERLRYQRDWLHASFTKDSTESL